MQAKSVGEWGNEERREVKGRCCQLTTTGNWSSSLPGPSEAGKKHIGSSALTWRAGSLVFSDSYQCLAELLGAGKSLALCIT